MFTPRVALPQQRTNHRRIVIVDIENLTGGAVLCCETAHWARKALAQAIGLTDDDQVVIGTSHIGLLNTAVAWPRQRYVVRSGADGADLALLEVLDEGLAARYDEIVLVTGDGIFADAAGRLAGAGALVHIVAQSDALSGRLRLAASKVTLLYSRPEPANQNPVAA